MSKSKIEQTEHRAHFSFPAKLMEMIDVEAERLRRETGIYKISRNSVVIKLLSEALGYEEE